MSAAEPAVPEMKLSVRYVGPTPERGRMGALEIGPAILGMGEIVGRASRVLHGDETRIRLDVQADFPHASFGLEFFAVAPLGGLVPGLALGDIANICTILGFGAGGVYGGVRGLLWLMRWQKGRKIEQVTRTGDEFNIRVDGGESVNISVNQYRVFVDPETRRSLRAVVAPLDREGVDAVEIKAGDDPPARIERGEREYFQSSPLPDEEVAIDQSTAVLEVVSPSFREGMKWRFAQGGNTFFAEIVDEAFLADVAKRRDGFYSGDALRVELETRTTRTADGFEFERRIMRVIKHIPADQGGQLPLV